MNTNTCFCFVWPFARILFLLAGLVLPSAAGELRRGDLIQVRLTTPICSYDSKPGDAVRALILGRANGGIEDDLAGAELLGTVIDAEPVGYGFRRNRGKLRVWFDHLSIAGTDIPIRATVASVDNAREVTDADGVIRGIDAGDSPVNKFTSRTVRLPSLNPYPDLALLTYKVVSPIFPDPEIHYAAGTEMSVILLGLAEYPDRNGPPAVSLGYDGGDGFESFARSLPLRTATPGKGELADVVNILLIGDAGDIDNAFELAGWASSDPRTAATYWKSIVAFLENGGYRTAPMSPQMVLGRRPDMTWQKGLNDQRKRHHVRVWQAGVWNGRTSWLVSATRDVGAGLSIRPFRTYHRIESNIDLERTKVVRDLVAAGCVDTVRWVDRPDAAARMVNATGDEMTTDGGLVAVTLGKCRATPFPAPAAVAARAKHGPLLKRWARKEVLSLRYDMIKANALYSGFEVGRLIWRTYRAWERYSIVR